MSELEIWMLAIGLAMDCFTVAIASGIILKCTLLRPMLVMSFFFGLFQALMPLAGWLGTTYFSRFIADYDHWIAFGILAFLGVRMIKESFEDEEEKKDFNPASLKIVTVLAVATSIDALAVGISFACLGYDSLTDIAYPILIIGLTSFLLSLVGLLLGIRFGKGIARKIRPELLGGGILIIIGTKILAEHTLL